MLDLTPESWKADKYRINDVQGVPPLLPRYEKRGGKTRCIEVASHSKLAPVNPFDFYRPSETGRREAKAGPHLEFLRLKDLAHEQPHLLEKGITLFAERYGLLGWFAEFLPDPVLKREQALIAPEAVIVEGKLRLIHPATEGIDLLLGLKREGKLQEPFLNNMPEDMFPRYVALPREVKLISPGRPQQSSKLVPWTEIRKRYGAILVWRAGRGVFPLCTREPLRSWRVALERGFPTPEELAQRASTVLSGVRPIFEPDEGGNLQPGWVCDSLWSAMHLMLCLDLSADSTIIRCASRGCPNYFRAGPWSKARYCSPRCASRASTRLSRGREA